MRELETVFQCIRRSFDVVVNPAFYKRKTVPRTAAFTKLQFDVSSELSVPVLNGLHGKINVRVESSHSSHEGGLDARSGVKTVATPPHTSTSSESKPPC